MDSRKRTLILRADQLSLFRARQEGMTWARLPSEERRRATEYLAQMLRAHCQHSAREEETSE